MSWDRALPVPCLAGRFPTLTPYRDLGELAQGVVTSNRPLLTELKTNLPVHTQAPQRREPRRERERERLHPS
jgi:hypothetical protein